ncbi:MAG: hypothetical protein ABW148_12160 [Sedimenticola sp.]
MFRCNLTSLLWVASSLLIHFAAVAEPSAEIEFSAHIRMTGPQGQVNEGRLYVGKGEVRTDLEQNGRQFIQISSEQRQVTLLVNPAKQTYIERQGVVQGLIERNRDGDMDPCQGVVSAECRLLGEETLLGRPARKWSVSINTTEGVARSIQWIDVERKILVRQESTDGGTHMEQRMVGVDGLNGRSVEKWEVTLSESDSAPLRSYRWFDPELNLVVREEHPNGYVREMTNFKIGEQSPKLFTVPAGFSKALSQ